MIDFNYVKPIVVEITLYQNNWKDNRLISALLNHTSMFTLPQYPDTYIVDRRDMQRLVETRFAKDLTSLQGIPDEKIYKDVSSIYFINNMLVHFAELQYFRIKVSRKRHYTRMTVREEVPFLDYGYRIVYAKLDLTKALGPQDLSKVKELLRESGLLSKSKIHKTPYLNVNVNEMFNIFGEREVEQNYFSEYFDETINTILDVVSEKLEKDNTNILLMLED